MSGRERQKRARVDRARALKVKKQKSNHSLSQLRRTVSIRKDAGRIWCTENPIDANELEKSGEGRGREGNK